MAKKSIGELNVKVSANAQQLLQEMKRADEATRASVSRMDKELGNLQRSMSRKFRLGDIGKDLMRGLGIGSGFAIAQQAADAIVKQWEEAAKWAQEVEAITDRITASVLSRMDARKSGEQLESALLERQAALAREIAALTETKTMTVGGRRDREGNVWDITRTVGPSGENLVRAAKLSEELEKLEVRLGETRKKLSDERVKQAEQGFDMVEKLDKANAEALARTAQGLADDRRRIAEEELKYQVELHQAELAATAARDKRLEESTEKRMERLQELVFAESEAAMENFKPAIEEFENEMAMMWSTVSDRAGQAFADMVLTGRASFASIAEMATRAVLEIAARMAIINPLLNAVFGGMGGWQALPAFSFGGGRALGGPVSPGTAYTVGERGRELFVPDTPGRIVSAGQTAAALGGAPVYNFTYNFASGVQRAEIMPLLRASERSTIARIAEAQRRGAPISAAI